MSVVTLPTPLRTPPEPWPKVWLEAPPNSLWGLVGRACVWWQDFGLGHVSEWVLGRLVSSSMMCGVYEEVDLRPEPVTYCLIRP